MKRPMEWILGIVCVVSLYRPFFAETSLLEFIGYIAMGMLSGALIVVLHLRPNGAEWIQPQDHPVEIPAAKPIGIKK